MKFMRHFLGKKTERYLVAHSIWQQIVKFFEPKIPLLFIWMRSIIVFHECFFSDETLMS